jgi:ketosteroid isomerase-like protein
MKTNPFQMNKPIFFVISLASMLTFAMSTPAPAQVDPLSLARQDVAAESRGDVAAAVALYSDDAIVRYGGLCWTPCVGKEAVQKEIERRVAAKNHATIIGTYVSGNVAVVKTEVRLTTTDKSGAERPIEWSPGVNRIVVWNIYEVKEGKIAVDTLVGQSTDPQTGRFIEWLKSWQ